MRRFAALLIVITISLALPGPASAVCADVSPDEAYEVADVIFSGRVTSTDDLSQPGPWHTTMRVDRVWKGEVREPAQLTVPPTTDVVRFQAGADYLVYGVQVSDSPRIHTNACMGTTRLDEAAANLAHLDRTVPEPNPWVAIGIVLLFIAGIVLVIRGRPKTKRIGPPAT